MTLDEQAAFDQVQLAEAELAVLKQELALQHLINMREPTEDARAILERLRAAVSRLAPASAPPDRNHPIKAA
jgi:hypothetical protein